MNTANMQPAPLPLSLSSSNLQSAAQQALTASTHQNVPSINTPEKDLSLSVTLASSTNSISPISPSSELKRKEIENLHLLEDYEWQSSGGSQFSKKAQCMRSRFHCAEKEKHGCLASYIKDTAPNTALVSLQFRGEHNHPKPMKKRHKSSSSLKPDEKLHSIQLQENKSQSTSSFQSGSLGVSSSSLAFSSDYDTRLHTLETTITKFTDLIQSGNFPIPQTSQSLVLPSSSSSQSSIKEARDPKLSASVYLNGTLVNRFLSGTPLHEIRVLYPNVCLHERVEYGITHVSPSFSVFGGVEYDLLFPQVGVHSKAGLDNDA